MHLPILRNESGLEIAPICMCSYVEVRRGLEKEATHSETAQLPRLISHGPSLVDTILPRLSSTYVPVSPRVPAGTLARTCKLYI